MVKNFFRTAIRHLLRNKTYALLNYFCLTFGLSCSIVICLYIQYILSYDKFHYNYKRLFAVEAYVTFFNGDRFPKEYLSASLTDLLKVNAPEITDMVRVAERDFEFKAGDIKLTEKGFYADTGFFRVFTFPIVRAGGQKILSDMNSIAISESMALKFFKKKDCIGESLILKNGDKTDAFNVAGVFRDAPRQSSMHFDFVIPFSRFMSENKWAAEPGATANRTWILLKDNIGRKQVENKIRDLIKSQETTLNQELFLFPMSEQILYNYAGGKRVWKEMQNIVIIGSIGFLILLIACSNFMNLALAMNFRRYKETGIKKVLGSDRAAIVLHFLGETLILTILSLLTAIILVKILVAGFNRMFSFNIFFHLLKFDMTAFLILITILTALISGLIPSLFLASSDPLSAIRGEIIKSSRKGILQQGIIVFQFIIVMVLIICIIIIRTQDSYMRSYDVGVDKDKLIIIDNTNNLKSHSSGFRADLLTIPGIEAVSFTNCVPSRGARVTNEVSWEGKDSTEKLHFWLVKSDFDYNKAVKVKITSGRFFSPGFSTDSSSYLVNDVAAAVMKNRTPVGSSITVGGKKGPVIGVFSNFHSIDLAGPLVPTIISARSGEAPYILVRYSTGSFREVSARIREIYMHYEKESVFHASLFSDLVPYSDLTLPSRMVGLAIIIATLLACLGLFGLASFNSENRTREIGIRKASGATTLNILWMLVSDYLKWPMIACLAAFPAAFVIGKSFLGRFYFHSPLPLWAFIVAPLFASAVALLTVAAISWRVANYDPSNSLRHE